MNSDWIITKRMIGIVITAAGVLGFGGLLVLDALRGQSDFGPTQQVGLQACVALTLLGLTLIPLGDRPA
jgi:hypothetical protein